MTSPSEFANAQSSVQSPQHGLVEALGQSEVFLEFQDKLSKVAPINRPVLLFGERGTGKELAASRLHFLSNRWQNPFITLNCSALSPSLIESELFGHERGAFTSASRQRTGRFEMADQGSFFLDEIGNIPLEAQEKILRVVEYGSFERVGSSNPIHVDVRIIAATNLDLSAKAAAGQFMRDLLDRLSFEVLYLPPLRERHGDIALLAHHFAARMAFEVGRDAIPRFSQRALATLEAYHWPGNIRELKNVVERAVYRSESAVINSIIFNPFENPYTTAQPAEKVSAKAIQPATASQAPIEDEMYAKPFHDAVQELKVQLLKNALMKANFNQKKAARILGMTYHQFRALYRKYRRTKALE
jgi:psp operon transcriptional activator